MNDRLMECCWMPVTFSKSGSRWPKTQAARASMACPGTSCGFPNQRAAGGNPTSEIVSILFG